MRKIFFLVAFLSASIMSFADKVYDVNFALASQGSSATASSGNAGAAIDGDNGTRWESAQTDDETWTLDMGQARTFSRIKILWEGAYAKEFTLSISNDGESWSPLYVETNLTQAGWQTIDVDETTARYIQYHGTLRATQWGQSFYEFQVLLPGVSVLTKIELSAPAIAKVAEGVNLAARALDQNNAEMSVALSYEITPADAGAVVDGKYVPAKVGNASIVAKSGTVSSPAIEIFGYEGSNLALSTNIVTDNKIVAQVAENPDGSANDAFFAVDGNDGSVWQGSLTNGTAGDEASRTFDAWFVVDLGANYSIDLITIHFEGACAQDYHVDFSEDNTNWVLGYNHVGVAGINGRTDMLSTQLDNNQKVRYVRFWSTKAGTEWGMKIFEFQVFGREYTASGDTEVPVMVSASLVSKTGTSAVIAVEATDNDEVAKYRVVESNHGIDAKYVANEGKITITGLQGATQYAFVITAFDAAQNESANSMVVNVTTDAHYDAPQAVCTAPTWPAAQVKAIYSPTYNANCNFQDWGSGTVYTETEFGKKFALANGGYFGMDGFALNCLLMEKLHADIWIADDATIRLVPIYGGAGLATDDTHGKFVSLTGGQWNSIDLDLATDFAGLNLASIFQFKIDNAANLTFWLGNLFFYRAEPIVDDDAPTNVQASVAGSGYFSVTLAVSAEDNSGSVSYRVMNGEKEVANGGGVSGATAHITVSGLQANAAYTFSVIAYDANNNATAPVNVQANTLVAPAPAALPTYDAADVKGVYTDNYTDVAMGIQPWYAEPAVSAGLLVENREALCITPNTTASSCFGLAFPAMDITAYDALELDIYPMAENAVLDILVVGVSEVSTTFNLTANQWNHVSLDIDGNTKTNCEQIGFYNCDKLMGVCFVQNVLFVQDGDSTAIEHTEVGPKAIKMIEKGQLIIIRDGKRYNVTGVRVE